MKNIKKLIIYGCGGHARSVADTAIANGIDDLLFVDHNAKPNETIFQYPVVNELREMHPYIVALGDAIKRAELFNYFNSEKAHTLISKHAYIGFNASIGKGTFVGNGVYIGPSVRIGNNTIINTHAVVEHDCEIGNHSHISINTTIAGKCKIGNFVMIGAGATLIDGISICDHVIIGAGGVATQNILEPGTYVGVPIRKIG